MKYVQTTALDSSAEQLSALFDGELSAEQALALISASLQDDAVVSQWREMSVSADVLRQGQPLASATPSLLTSEPPALSELALAKTAPAANEGIFRWKMIAGVAALAAVGSLVWGLLGQQTGAAGPVLAQNAVQPNLTTVQVGSAGASQEQPMVMIRDPRLDEFLAAHRQFGGMSALQQPAGSLRSASLASHRP